MKNSINLITILLSVMLIIMSITACSNTTVETNGNESTAFTASTTQIVETTETKTTSETTTQKSENSDTTTKPAEQRSAGQSITKKVTTTQKSTTTQRQTTTKKVTTTQKPATTKKVTTTEDDWDCNVDGHSCEVGPIGWVNSEAEATDKALEYIASHDDSGNFRIRECYWCGKYTAKITLD